MGLLDLWIKQAQEKIEGQAENIAKKLGATPGNIVKKTEQPKAANVKAPNQKRKPAASIEAISKQIIAQRDSIKRNDFNEYEFIANKDCCEICAALNGKHFFISDLKIGVNAPPMHEGCKCSITAYEDDEAYNEWLNKF